MGIEGYFLRFYFDSFELLRSGRKNHVGKKVLTWYNDFAFHVGNHVGIQQMPTWVRKTAIICLVKNNNNNYNFSFIECNLKITTETILLIKNNQKLTFNSHVQTLKTGQELCALLRISNYLDQNEKTFCMGHL